MAIPFPQGTKRKRRRVQLLLNKRIGSSEPFFSSGERCEPAKSAKPERPQPQSFRVSLSGAPRLSPPQRLPLGIPVIIANMPLRRIQARENQKETRDGRDGVALACHLHVLSLLARVAHRSKRIACLMLSYPIAWK